MPAAAEGSWKPRVRSVSSVPGSSSVPVKTRLPPGPARLGGRLGGDVVGGGERPQRLAGATQPERRIAAAEDQLLGLGEELDLPDAAAAEFQVVSEHAHRAAAAIGVDLALDRMDVVDRR